MNKFGNERAPQASYESELGFDNALIYMISSSFYNDAALIKPFLIEYESRTRQDRCFIAQPSLCSIISLYIYLILIFHFTFCSSLFSCDSNDKQTK